MYTIQVCSEWQQVVFMKSIFHFHWGRVPIINLWRSPQLKSFLRYSFWFEFRYLEFSTLHDWKIFVLESFLRSQRSEVSVEQTGKIFQQSFVLRYWINSGRIMESDDSYPIYVNLNLNQVNVYFKGKNWNSDHPGD